MIVVNQRRGVETQSAVQQVARRGGHPRKTMVIQANRINQRWGKDVE